MLEWLAIVMLRTLSVGASVLGVYAAYRAVGMFIGWVFYKTDKEEGQFAAENNLAPTRTFPVYRPLVTCFFFLTLAWFLYHAIQAPE